MHLHCTQKLFKAFGFSKDRLDSSSPSSRLFGWHAHIVFIARVKTVIAINDQTFFAVIMPGIKKARLENFAQEFSLALSSVLKSEGFGDSHRDVLLGERIAYLKAHNRQVLGIINQIVQELCYYIEDNGGWEKTSVIELCKRINRTPWLAGTRNTIFPIDQITNELRDVKSLG